MHTNDTHPEKELIQRFQAGDEAAFSVIYKEFYQRVLYFSMRYVPEASAQDITAEAFVQLWHKKAHFPTTSSVAQFLFVTAKNRCYNAIRHDQVRRDYETNVLNQLSTTTDEALDIEAIRLELIQLLQQEVDKLPQKTREVFLLSFQEGLKPLQIAERLGVSVKTVSNQKLTAIKLLKASVAKHPLEVVFLALLQIEYFGIG